MSLDAARVRELFDYDPETGLLIRRISVKRNAIKAGTPLTSMNSDGYYKVKIDKAHFVVHRVIWLHQHGSWPNGPIDHINGVKTDNRMSNLRDATLSINSQNLRHAHPSKKSGLPLGVFNLKKGPRPFRAGLAVNGKLKNLGNYATPDEAHAAYVVAKRALHPGCTI